MTKSMIAVKIKDDLRYEMPRYGRVIRVRNKKGKRVYDLVWTGEQFRLRK